MIEYIWTVGNCKYSIEENSKVKVTELHWRCNGIEGEHAAGSYGSVSVSDQNRVYALPALLAVPAHVMVNWIKEAIGEEGVQAIEDGIQGQILEQQTPTSGGFAPVTE